ncbi:Predicted ATPase (AAA+ superfamily) [uncultured Clostridium sp.]|nr:Predicted ATPase (AAA+ superfamily) [uncultured Clostridium sp.]
MLDYAKKSLMAFTKGYPQQPVIYYGLRGVGKTVLLNAIEKRADDLDILYTHIEVAEKRSFIAQLANASKKTIYRMSTVEKAKTLAKRAIGIVQAFTLTYNPEDQTISAGWSEPSPYITTGVLSEDLTDMFVNMGNLAAKTENVICFFIDEIQYMKDDEMEALVNALHRVNQLRLPIIIFGAGLPKVLKILGEVKSYAERLFKYIEVAELPNDAAREAICRPAEDFNVTYTDEAVNEILNWTKG